VNLLNRGEERLAEQEKPEATARFLKIKGEVLLTLLSPSYS
jgi:hypothetical protein